MAGVQEIYCLQEMLNATINIWAPEQVDQVTECLQNLACSLLGWDFRQSCHLSPFNRVMISKRLSLVAKRKAGYSDMDCILVVVVCTERPQRYS